jgi:DNA-binding MarR family transcriptional regulator
MTAVSGLNVGLAARARKTERRSVKKASLPNAQRQDPMKAPKSADEQDRLTTAGYRLLAGFRYEVRRFLAFSEQAARGAGLEPQQHQLLLALRGLPEGKRPTVGTLAERLCIQPHTAVPLVDKLEERGLLRRERGMGDRREVLVRITPRGETILRKLSSVHREQIASMGPALVEALDALLTGRAPDGENGLMLGALTDPRAHLTPVRPYGARTARPRGAKRRTSK